MNGDCFGSLCAQVLQKNDVSFDYASGISPLFFLSVPSVPAIRDDPDPDKQRGRSQCLQVGMSANRHTVLLEAPLLPPSICRVGTHLTSRHTRSFNSPGGWEKW
jgi:hypothetical protein